LTGAGFESKIKTVEWMTDGSFSRMVNQLLVPYEFKTVDIESSQGIYDAIKTMVVRGAPAIGIAGAHGVALAAIELCEEECESRSAEGATAFAQFKAKLLERCEFIKSARPTAVNLSWAIEEQKSVLEGISGIDEAVCALIDNAIRLENEDIEINKKIGDFGAAVVPKGATILTHCNAGALATVGYGTALGVVRSAFAKDNAIQVFANETRPRGQGARITTFELVLDGIPTTLITDGMCSYFMEKKMIDLVVVGADRIAANGDTANKIGTYTVAIAAKYHNIPFYVAAPKSTIDMSIADGSKIPIELRDREEVTHINGKIICAPEVNVINPAFDVTPNELITGIITEVGIFTPDELRKAF